MTQIPRYVISNCCGPQYFVDVNLENTAGFEPGLYTWNEPQLIVAEGLVLNTGQCYTIVPAQTVGSTGITIDLSNFSFNNQTSLSQDCSTYDEDDCLCPWLYYISPCCPEFGDQGAAAQQVNLLLSDIPYEDGTYIYGGTTLPIPGTNLILEQGQCYTFTRNLQDDPIQTLIELDFSSSSWQQMNLELGCNDSRCEDCPEEGITYLKFEPCCDRFDTIYVQTETYTGQGLSGGAAPIVNIADYLGVFVYNGTALPSQNSAPFVAGQCYTGTLHTLGTEAAPAPQDEIDYNKLPLAPYSTQLGEAGDCERPPCPECRPTVYSLTDCAGITINTETDLSAYIGTYIELEDIEGCWFVQEYSVVNEIKDPSAIIGGKLVASNELNNTLPGLQTQPVTVTGPCDGCDCLCYEVIGYSGTFSYIDCETGKSVLVFSTGADKFCAATAPSIVGVEGEDYTLVVGGDCVDNECPTQCFYLRNCEPEKYTEQDPIIFSNLQSLSQYAGTSSVVQIANFEGCWQVFNAECTCINLTIQIGGDLPRQYQAGLVYFDSNDNAVYSFDLIFDNGGIIEQYVYYLWFNTVNLQWYITQTVGDTSNPLAQTDIKVGVACPAPIVEQWVPLNGPDGASIVQLITSALCEDQCVCPIDVTVITDFESCVSCLPTIAYKLTSCSNPLINTYTTQDLSQYVDKVVKDDCDCYTVQEIDYQPPIDTPITIDQVYDDCELCQAEFFILTDCNNSENTVITNTDLTVYLGQYIKIKNCSFCFFVEPYTDVPEFVEAVTVEENFTTCFDCNQVPPRCSTVFNNSTEDRTFTFINANGDPEQTAIVKSGHFSLRYCVQTWEEDDSFIYNFYGDCTVYEDESGTKTGMCIQHFPNKRKVKPGYNTPICSADKYDKITCNFADIAYKKVLELRYGISNCCPEEDEKWLIKKELIELQALTDPDYICNQIADCCGNSTSHCSCNS
jgi:hypothetical protein